VVTALLHALLRSSGSDRAGRHGELNYATDASRGTIARRYKYHYGQGLGMNHPAAVAGATESDSLVDGARTPATSIVGGLGSWPAELAAAHDQES